MLLGSHLGRGTSACEVSSTFSVGQMLGVFLSRCAALGSLLASTPLLAAHCGPGRIDARLRSRLSRTCSHSKESIRLDLSRSVQLTYFTSGAESQAVRRLCIAATETGSRGRKSENCRRWKNRGARPDRQLITLELLVARADTSTHRRLRP